MSRTKPIAAAALAVVAVAAAPARADDIHLYRGESRTDVTIVDETYDSVTYKQKGIPSPQELPASKVKSVVYTKAPTKEWERAAIAMAEGRLGDASLLFQTAAAKAKNWEKQYGLFNVGECQRGQRMLDDAIKAYNTLLTEVPKTKFFGDCYEKIAACQRAQGKAADARKTYETLKGQVAQKGLSPRWAAIADFRLIELSEKDDPAAALRAYDELQQKAAEFPDVANMARLRVGYVMIQQQKIDRARSYFQDIIKDRQASDTATVAGAYNGLGTTYVAKDAPTTEDFEAALFPFFRTIFHYGDELGSNELIAEALYWGGRCLENREGDNNQKRARQLYDRCKSEYPTSEWAKMAALR
jgi:TolA-binding protein